MASRSLPFALKPGWPELEQARYSQDPEVIVKGLKALQDCASYMNNTELATTTSLAESRAKASPRRDERLAAAKALVTRCQGFPSQHIGPNEEAQMWARAAALGNAEASAYQYQMSAASKTAALLADGSLKVKMCNLVVQGKEQPEALEVSSHLVATALKPSILGSTGNGLSKRNLSEAVQLAACKLGSKNSPCSRDSVMLAGLCAIAGECDVRSELELDLRMMTDAERSGVEALAAKILASVEARNCEGLF